MSGSFLKNKRGFSLVELMVVVAIIGILASIAIPSIGRYMAKARQSEAKANLSSMYTAQKAFLAEYNTYTGIFEVIGFTPEGNLRYNIGYGGVGVAFATLATYGYTAAAPPTSSFDAGNYCNTGNNNLCTTLADATAVALAGFTNPTNAAFVAAAQGRIKNNSTSTNGVDQWRIDEAKNITNNIDGTQ